MLEHKQFMVKEHVTMLKTTDTYDIMDPESKAPLGQAREVPGGFVAAMRWLISKQLMPTRIEVRDASNKLLFYLRRGWYIFRAKIRVYSADDELIGWFRSKILTVGGAFQIYDDKDKLFAEIKGGRRWFFDYHLRTPDCIEIGSVTKKFGGILKELFTSSDAFLVTVARDFEDNDTAKILLLAAALAIDSVYKEDQSAGLSSIPGGE